MLGVTAPKDQRYKVPGMIMAGAIIVAAPNVVKVDMGPAFAAVNVEPGEVIGTIIPEDVEEGKTELSKKLIEHIELLAESVGFEPTWPIARTVRFPAG